MLPDPGYNSCFFFIIDFSFSFLFRFDVVVFFTAGLLVLTFGKMLHLVFSFFVCFYNVWRICSSERLKQKQKKVK